ncbi:ABC transporter permease [Candidatus Gracilibacteria bacterium]|nr:ABC transporter permease [Candidatus Gracilibacteria bacterium]MCF7898338.1 ABC transporter permease [Candidatus Paceibacterota bacterium]
MDNFTHRLRLSSLIRLSLRTFKVNPVRAFLTIAGMSVGIGTVMVLISFGYGLQYILLGKLVTTEDSLITMEVYYPSEANLNITKKEVEEIRAIPDVKEVSQVAEFPGEIKLGGLAGSVQVKVVEPNYFRLTGLLTKDEIDAFEKSGGAIISSQTVGLIQSDKTKDVIGGESNLKLFYEDEKTGTYDEATTTESVVLRAIITDENSPPFAIISPGVLSKEPPFFRSLLVKAVDIEHVEKVRDTLTEKGFIVSARIDLVNQARKIMNIITVVLGVFGITALIVSAIGMLNTMIVGFMERIYEIGIMKSIGVTNADVRNLFLMESTIMGFLGGVGGVTIGYLIGKIIDFGVSSLAVRLGGEAFSLFITPLWFVLFAIGLSVLIGLFSGLWPAWKVSNLSPKEAFIRK